MNQANCWHCTRCICFSLPKLKNRIQKINSTYILCLKDKSKVKYEDKLQDCKESHLDLDPFLRGLMYKLLVIQTETQGPNFSKYGKMFPVMKHMMITRTSVFMLENTSLFSPPPHSIPCYLKVNFLTSQGINVVQMERTHKQFQV